MEGCGNTCAALFRAVDAALEGEAARDGEATHEREAAREREAAQAGENVRVGEECGGMASDGGGGTGEAWARVPPLGAPTLRNNLRASPRAPC